MKLPSWCWACLSWITVKRSQRRANQRIKWNIWCGDRWQAGLLKTYYWPFSKSWRIDFPNLNWIIYFFEKNYLHRESMSFEIPIPQSGESQWPYELYQILKNEGISQFSYVPDAGHKVLINLSLSDPEVHSIPLTLSLIHIWRCRRYSLCRSRWSPYH